MNLQAGYTSSAHFKCLEDLRRDYVDLYLSYCGTENCFPGFGFGPQTRTEYVLHVVTKGKGIFQTGQKTFPLKAGQAFLIFPGEETYYEADKREPWSYIWVGFNGLKANECAAGAGFTKEAPTGTFSCTEALVGYVDQMLEAHQLTYANELKRNSCMLLFFAALIEDHQSASQDAFNYDYPGSVYVKQAVNYLSLNYSQRIKINDLAKYIGINRSYLTNSFKKVMKVSPQEFLVNLRMEKAVSLLSQTDLSVGAIASHVGYEDPLAFSKIFKQKYGLSPKTYRETPELLITGTKKRESDGM